MKSLIAIIVFVWVALLVYIIYGLKMVFCPKYDSEIYFLLKSGILFYLCFVFFLLICYLKINWLTCRWLRWVLRVFILILCLIIFPYAGAIFFQREGMPCFMACVILSAIISVCYILFYLISESDDSRSIEKTEKKDPEKNDPEKNDYLHRAKLYNHIYESIKRNFGEENKEGRTIGICGRWGSGKSFCISKLLRLLSKESALVTQTNNVEKKEFIICDKVDIWDATTPDEAWNRIIFSLQKGITGSCVFSSSKIWKLIPFVIFFFGGDREAIKEIYKLVLPDYDIKEAKAIAHKLGKRNLVLVIDDLERANFDVIQAMLPLFERLKKIQNLIVICALSEDELCEAFGSRMINRDVVYGYLNKLFDLRFQMPKLDLEGVKSYQGYLLENKYSDCKLLKTFLENNSLCFDEARQIERVLEKLASIEREYYMNFPYVFDSEEEVELSEKGVGLKIVKFIFLVVALQLAHPEVGKEIECKSKLSDFIRSMPSKLAKYNNDLFSYSKNCAIPDKNWRKKYPITHDAIMQNGIVWCILTLLKNESKFYSENQFDQMYYHTIHGQYPIYTDLKEFEYKKIIEENKGNPFSKLIMDYCSHREEKIQKIYYPIFATSLLDHAWRYVFEMKNKEQIKYIKKSIEEDNFSDSYLKKDGMLPHYMYAKFLDDKYYISDMNEEFVKDIKGILVKIYHLMSLRSSPSF